MAASTDDVLFVAPSNQELRDEFVCPITRELMRDPCIAADGHTYDRASIERWLQKRTTSPRTGDPLPHTHLATNHNLKKLIDDLIAEGGAGLYQVAEDEDAAEPADPKPSRRALVLERILVFRCLGPPETDWNNRSFTVSRQGCIGGRKRPEDGRSGADFISFATDATVSRNHFEIAYAAPAGHFTVTDLGSASGTFLRVG